MSARLTFLILIGLVNWSICLAQNETFYGDNFSTEQVRNVADIDLIMEGKDSLEIVLSGEIYNTCQVKGCWMTLDRKEKDPIRVSFKNYGFFVPKEDMSGKKATVFGTCYLKETSVDQLKHFALDAGQSALEIEKIQSAKIEYTFVASGVKIEN